MSETEYIVVKVVRYQKRVKLPAGMSEEDVTSVIYDLAESGTWDEIETIDSDWEIA